LLWKIEFSRHQISLVSLGQGTLLSKLNFPEKKNIEQVNIDRIRIEQDNDPKTEMLFDLCLDLKNKEVIKLMKFNLSELFIKLEQVISIGTQIAEFYNIEFEMDDKVE
jgi:hypothetical protein